MLGNPTAKSYIFKFLFHNSAVSRDILNSDRIKSLTGTKFTSDYFNSRDVHFPPITCYFTKTAILSKSYKGASPTELSGSYFRGNLF